MYYADYNILYGYKVAILPTLYNNMQDNFLERFDLMKHRKSKVNLQEEALLQELQRTKIALETAYSNFENSLDPDLIDAYIYEVNAAHKRYTFLLNQVKALSDESLLL